MVDLNRLKLCVTAGFSHAQVAKALGIARSTAADYVHLYKAGDLEEIGRRNRIAQDVMERKAQVGRMEE
jgi:predicted transcriptional regulator